MRTVHFLFDPKTKVKITPFTRKYLRVLDNSLASFEAEEKSKYEAFIESVENESLEGGNDEYNVMKSNPIVFEMMPLQHFELTNMAKISFSVADDPFIKSARGRFFPEVVVMNMKGVIKAKVNPNCRKYVRQGKDALMFEEDFREPKLKINDDRRIQINLNALHPKDKAAAKNQGSTSQLSHNSKKSKEGDAHAFNGKMILLTVKIFTDNFKGAPVKTGEFDRAWYRLVN